MIIRLTSEKTYRIWHTWKINVRANIKDLTSIIIPKNNPNFHTTHRKQKNKDKTQPHLGPYTGHLPNKSTNSSTTNNKKQNKKRKQNNSKNEYNERSVSLIAKCHKPHNNSHTLPL